jgi:asparagine synthase (glutamine-hydrolysing)
MCGIIGFINFENSVRETLKSMKNISYRGKDGNGILIGKKIYTANSIDELREKTTNFNSNISIGHNLHSIVSKVFQPIKKKGILVSNCEIYNWEELKKMHKLNSNNDAELLLDLIEKTGMEKTLNKILGAFAFAYLHENKIILARDILGEKPLYYSHKNGKFCFASEKKAIEKFSPKELNPREILEYDIESDVLKIKKIKLYYPEKETKESYKIIKEKTEKLLLDAIKRQVPKDQKIGILFSGGIDSTFIAFALKKLKIPFTCYTAKVEGGNILEAEDLIYAKEIAQEYDFDLKIAVTNTDELLKYTKKVISLIEDRDYIKVSVALPFFIACERAKKDNVKVMFSGLGSEEIFAGYRRHKKVEDPNLECYNGLLTLHSRDLYRDDVITMANNQELRLPYLDMDLIKYALSIPVKYKLSDDKIRSKIVLRDIAKGMGLNEKYCERQKKAAQYGSKFDKGLLRLAKDANLSKQEFLDSL